MRLNLYQVSLDGTLSLNTGMRGGSKEDMESAIQMAKYQKTISPRRFILVSEPEEDISKLKEGKRLQVRVVLWKSW